MTSLTELPS